MRPAFLRAAIIGAGVALTLGGCTPGDVELAFQRDHQAKGADIHAWSKGVESGVKDLLPGIRWIPAAYADKVN